MPIGTLMNSVQRHEPTSVTTPPSSRPMDAPAGGDGAEEGEGPVAGGLVGGAGGEQGQDARGGHGGADALEGAGDDQLGRGLGEAAEQRERR